MEESESMFSMTPMTQKLMLAPGETYEGVVKVFAPAEAEGDFQYKAEVVPYGVVADGGDYAVDLATETNQTQLAQWITIDEPLGVLKPNGTREIRYTIKVPETAAGGGQYAAIMVGSDDRDSSSASGLNIRNIYNMASIIYVKVEGEIVREGRILGNEVPGFVTATPMKVKVELENKGNIHETATIRLEVKNFLNGATIYPTNGEDGEMEEMIMPGTSRVVEREVKEMPALGLYEMTQSVDYMGEHASVTQLVVACPVWFMAMLVMVIAIIVMCIVASVKRHKKKMAEAMIN